MFQRRLGSVRINFCKEKQSLFSTEIALFFIYRVTITLCKMEMKSKVKDFMRLFNNKCICRYICMYVYNCRNFGVLAQYPFTASQMELRCYQQKVNVRVAAKVSKQLKTCEIRKFQNNSCKMLEFYGGKPKGK